MNVEQCQLGEQEPAGEVLLRIRGTISQREFDSEDPLASHVAALTDGGRLKVDLSGTEFIDSSGIGWLIRTHQQLQKNGCELILLSPSPMVLRSFKVLRLDSIIKIEDENIGPH